MCVPSCVSLPFSPSFYILSPSVQSWMSLIISNIEGFNSLPPRDSVDDTIIKIDNGPRKVFTENSKNSIFFHSDNMTYTNNLQIFAFSSICHFGVHIFTPYLL